MAATTTRSVERALQLLTVVCNNPGINLTGAAQQTDLAPSSALRLLNTLAENGFIARDKQGRFTAGVHMLQLGFKVLDQESLRTLAKPTMQELAQHTGESIYLSVQHQNQALYIGLVAGTHAVQHRSWEGQTIPLRSTAAGAALTGRLKGQPFAVVSNSVETDVMAIAAPIIVKNQTIAALSMLVPLYRTDEHTAEKYGELISSQAKKLAELYASAPKK